MAGSLWLGLALAGWAAAPTALDAPPGLAAFEQLTLDNGLRVLLGTPARPVELTEALLVVQAGTRSQGPGEEESARVAAEAFLGGKLAGQETTIRRQLARAGVTLDYTVGREVAVFRFAVPERQTAVLVSALAGLLRRESPGPAVWEQAVETRKLLAAAEEADPWQRSLRTLDGLLWHEPGSDRPGSDRRTAGGEPGVAPDLARLEAFRTAAYRADRMVIALWGEAPVAELGALVRHELAARTAETGRSPVEEPAEPELRPAEPGLRPEGGLRCLTDPAAEPPALLVGLGAELPDDRSFYGWQLVAHILGASHTSRLHERLRVREPFVYTVEATCNPVGSRGMTLRISAQTEELERARQVVMEELRRLASEEVSQQELDLARAIFRSRLLLDQGSFRDQFYRRALALLSTRPPRDLAPAAAALDALTPASLLAILRRTLRPELTSTVVVSAAAEPLCARAPS